MDIYVQPEILIDGEKSLSIYRSIKISFHHNSFSSFIVSLPSGNDIDISSFFSGNKRLIGKKITLVLRSGKEKKDDLIFTGFIDQIQFSQNQGLTPDLVIRAFDPSKMLDGQPDTNTFINMSIEDIVDQVLKPYSKSDLKLKKQNVRNNQKFEYLVQYKESDYNFLRRIASETGNWFYFMGTELFLGNPSKDSERKLYLGNTLTDFQIDFNTAPYKTKFVGYNFRKSEILDFELKDSDLRTSGNSVAQDLVKSSGSLYSAGSLVSTGDEFADLKAGQEKNKVIGESIVSQLVLLHGKGRDSGLLPGKFVSVNSPLVSQDSGLASKGKKGDKSYGSYMVINSGYDIEQSGEIFSEFTAVSSAITAPLKDSNFTNPVCESQPAEVIDNEDPEGLGRVKVRFFWQDKAASTPWIRVDQIHAGNEYGAYFVPEIGDQVMMGFQDSNPDRPYVLGSVYHKESNQKANQEKGNNVKSIKTRSGNEIRFYDKSGEESISIINPQGKNSIVLTLKDEISISLFSENIHLDAKKITITGEESVKINSKKISIEGSDEVLVKSNKIEASANSSLKASSASSMEIKGLTTKVEASTELSLKGGVAAKLEGGAQAVVKGGIVMIN